MKGHHEEEMPMASQRQLVLELEISRCTGGHLYRVCRTEPVKGVPSHIIHMASLNLHI